MSSVLWLVTAERGGIGLSTTAAVLATTLREEGAAVLAVECDYKGDLRKLLPSDLRVLAMDSNVGSEDWSRALDEAAAFDGQTVISTHGGLANIRTQLVTFIADALACGIPVNLVHVSDPIADPAVTLPTLEAFRCKVVLVMPSHLGTELGYRSLVEAVQDLDGFHLLRMPALSAPAMHALVRSGSPITGFSRDDTDHPLYVRESVLQWRQEGQINVLAGIQGA